MELKNVVPWGRSLAEYRAMFSLTDEDLSKTILGCADGPASFNAELSSIGKRVVSVDPIYQFNRQQIESRSHEVYPEIMQQVSDNKDDFVWNAIHSTAHLGEARMKAMTAFLADYDNGKSAGRYVTGSLPVLTLPFSVQRAY